MSRIKLPGCALLLLVLAGCSWVQPFVDRRRNAGAEEGKLYVGQSRPEAPVVCYNGWVTKFDELQKMLDHYHCEMPLEAVKMRFAGAVCSPNMELRPTDVISSLWPENREPRLQTKEEAELFFKFFMGLWDEIFEQVRHNEVRLPPYLPETSREYWRELCRRR